MGNSTARSRCLYNRGPGFLKEVRRRAGRTRPAKVTKAGGVLEKSARNRRVHWRRQSFSIEIIHDVQAPKPPSLTQSIRNKIHRPSLVLPGRDRQRLTFHRPDPLALPPPQAQCFFSLASSGVVRLSRVHALLRNGPPGSVPSRSPHGEETHAGDVDGHSGHSDRQALPPKAALGSHPLAGGRRSPVPSPRREEPSCFPCRTKPSPGKPPAPMKVTLCPPVLSPDEEERQHESLGTAPGHPGGRLGGFVRNKEGGWDFEPELETSEAEKTGVPSLAGSSCLPASRCRLPQSCTG